MKYRFTALISCLLLLAAGCASRPSAPAKSAAPAASVTAPAPAPVASQPAPIAKEPATDTEPVAKTQPPDLYALHHRVFPNLLFKTEGRFFTSLHNGEFERLHEIITENFGAAYSKAMRIKSVSLPDVVFISFEEPARPPLCYHVALVKKGDTFLYLTLEKSEDILSTGVKSAFCGWTADGSHVNYGSRHYTSLADFEEDVRKFLAQTDHPEPAAITTPSK